jgi:cystathionine beta-lyase
LCNDGLKIGLHCFPQKLTILLFEEIFTMDSKNMHFNTKAIHGGQQPDKAYGAVMSPIYQTSTYAQTAPGEHKGYVYSRSANPTRDALERALASLENGLHGMAFASGLAAIDAIMRLLESGDEVIASKDIYGGSYRLFTKILNRYGIVFRFVAMENVADLKQHINKRTKLIWVETPTNPMMNIIDVEALALIAKKHGVLLAVDNTFASPYLQRPLDLGADIVMHSATKYLGGHSDVVAGGLVVKDAALAKELCFIQNACGAICGPMDSFLTLRGMKTLHVRMQRHCDNGRVLAHVLREHKNVEKVYWPGFEDHPNHDVAKHQMLDYGGMISFVPKGASYDIAKRIVERLKVFTLAESLGGVESLVGHPASMTHASIPKREREKVGVVDALIRLSVGIEDVNDLMADLEQALK